MLAKKVATVLIGEAARLTILSLLHRDAMAVLAMEAATVLSERSMEVSFASALSTVSSSGTAVSTGGPAAAKQRHASGTYRNVSTVSAEMHILLQQLPSGSISTYRPPGARQQHASAYIYLWGWNVLSLSACTGMLHDLLAKATWGLMCLHLHGLVFASVLRCCSGLAPADSPSQALFKQRKAAGSILHLDTLS